MFMLTVKRLNGHIYTHYLLLKIAGSSATHLAISICKAINNVILTSLTIMLIASISLPSFMLCLSVVCSI